MDVREHKVRHIMRVRERERERERANGSIRKRGRDTVSRLVLLDR